MTMVMDVIMGYGWVMIVVLAVVTTPKRKWGSFHFRNNYNQVMIIVTTVIISVEGNRNIHGLVMMLVMIVICHHGQAMIVVTVVIASGWISDFE